LRLGEYIENATVVGWVAAVVIKKNPKVIWEEATSPPLVANLVIAAMYNRSTVFAKWLVVPMYRCI